MVGSEAIITWKAHIYTKNRQNMENSEQGHIDCIAAVGFSPTVEKKNAVEPNLSDVKFRCFETISGKTDNEPLKRHTA